MMPLPGGTTRTPSNELAHQRRKAKRSPLRSYSRARLMRAASGLAQLSTCSEWSMMTSTATLGLTVEGSPPACSTASRIAAMSSSMTRPRMSCPNTRAG